MDSYNPFDSLSNDIISHILLYTERTTDMKHVCKRFARIYAQYRIYMQSERILIGDFIINTTVGTIEWIGIEISPTTIAFRQKENNYSRIMDCLGLFQTLCESNSMYAAWISVPQNIFHLAQLAPTFTPVAMFPLKSRILEAEQLVSHSKRRLRKPLDWRIELGDHCVVLWSKGREFLFVFDLVDLRLLARNDYSDIVKIARVSFIGAKEEHLAVTVAKPRKEMLLLDRCTLKPSLVPANETQKKDLQGYACARRIKGTDRMILCTSGGLALGKKTQHWATHDVVCWDFSPPIENNNNESNVLDGKLPFPSLTIRELWRVKDVTPDASLRLPGARSSGFANARLGKGSHVALCNGSTISTEDGVEVLAPFAAASNLTFHDVVRFLHDDSDRVVGRLHISRNAVERTPQATPASPVEFLPLAGGPDADYPPLKFHVVHFKDAVPSADMVLVGQAPEHKFSLHAVGFVLSEGVLVFNTHTKNGKCCLRAVCLRRGLVGSNAQPGETLWRVALPFTEGRCRCASKEWRLKLFASGEKLTALYYPVSPSSHNYPMCAFFWILNGAPCSEVLTLRSDESAASQGKKCFIM